MKKLKYLISSVLIAGLVVSGMAGCGSKNTHQGGEDTNFPYTWKEESNGSVLIRLDGSYGPEDYRWTAVSSGEEVVAVEVVKKEKKGKISYRIKPLAEGSAQVTFTRQREVAGAAEIAEASEAVETVENIETNIETAESVASDGEMEAGPVPAMDGLGAEGPQEGDHPQEEYASQAEAPQEEDNADELYERFLERYRVKDVLSEITFQIGVDHSGKKGKLKISAIKASGQERKGVMESEDTGFDYKLWEASSGELQLSLPIVEEGWETSWEGEYIPPEDPGIPGITSSEPEKENDRYVILRIKSNGVIEGAQSYTVQGLAQGTATLWFTDSQGKRRITVEVEISPDGVVTVISHRLEAL